MARISLKNIVGKKNEVNAAVLALMSQLNEATWIEDENGKLLLGNPTETSTSSFPVNLDNEIIGFVKGDENSIMIANLLAYLAQKEAEKKKAAAPNMNTAEIDSMRRFILKPPLGVEVRGSSVR